MKTLIALILAMLSADASAACNGTPLPSTVYNLPFNSGKEYFFYYYHALNGKTYKIIPSTGFKGAYEGWLIRKPNGEYWFRSFAGWGYYPPASFPPTITDCVGEKVVTNLLGKPYLWILK